MTDFVGMLSGDRLSSGEKAALELGWPSNLALMKASCACGSWDSSDMKSKAWLLQKAQARCHTSSQAITLSVHIFCCCMNLCRSMGINV